VSYDWKYTAYCIAPFASRQVHSFFETELHSEFVVPDQLALYVLCNPIDLEIIQHAFSNTCGDSLIVHLQVPVQYSVYYLYSCSRQ